ncbi:hypothetical protein Dsin_017172 [Dipteronia sinensis]|uniref:Ninja-family protein n=1 Tax=Dipteronia sinensis TaxID=43782 RepID=A0AAE0E667_9ROSI|nr:hypothetical protein Dsin_017172 [Dipteronia sinensis]
MEKTKEIGARETQQHISMMQVSKIPRDLLHRFMNGNHLVGNKNQQQQSEEKTEKIQLSLGLSLNGRFGVDPTRDEKLSRSSSIPDFMNPTTVKEGNNNDSSAFVLPMACANLIRICSLPTETEEDWRMRKELQTFRRMQAKRKRSEKQQRNSKIAGQRSRAFGEEIDNKEEAVIGSKGAAAIIRRAGGDDGAVVEGGLPPPAIVASQGSNGSSQASGLSTISEFESQPSQAIYFDFITGLNKCSEAISTSSVQSVTKSGQKLPPHPEAATTEKTGQFVVAAMENDANRRSDAKKGVREAVMNVLDDMPCVATKGDGPNGKRIEGFLYRYSKGEEVRIVCVCHGSFLSPAEFVKHAGGGDVAHPLKHIVVNPSPLL